MMRRYATGLMALVLALAVPAPDAHAQSALSNCKYYTKVLQDFKTGLPYCEQCVKDEPENPEARFLAGWCFAEVGMYSEAYAAFEPLLDKTEDKDKSVRENARNAKARLDEYHYKLFKDGVQLLGDGDMAGARERFTHAAQINPKDIPSQLNLGYTNQELGDLEAALAAYRSALAAEPAHVDANKYFSVALSAKLDSLRSGAKPDSASVAAVRSELIPVLQVIAEKDTSKAAVATAYAQLGGLQLESGQQEAGLASLKRAAEMDPQNAVLLYNTGVDLLNAESFAAAGQVFQMTAEVVKDPSNEIWPDAMYNLGLSYYNAGEFAKCAEVVEKLVAVVSDQKDYFNMLTVAYAKIGETTKAAEAAKKRDALGKAAGGQ